MEIVRFDSAEMAPSDIPATRGATALRNVSEIFVMIPFIGTIFLLIDILLVCFTAHGRVTLKPQFRCAIELCVSCASYLRV